MAWVTCPDCRKTRQVTRAGNIKPHNREEPKRGGGMEMRRCPGSGKLAK